MICNRTLVILSVIPSKVSNFDGVEIRQNDSESLTIPLSFDDNKSAIVDIVEAELELRMFFCFIFIMW